MDIYIKIHVHKHQIIHCTCTCILTDKRSWAFWLILGKISIHDLGGTTLKCLCEIGVSGGHSLHEGVPIILKREETK